MPHQAFKALSTAVSPVTHQHPTTDSNPENIFQCFCWFTPSQDSGKRWGSVKRVYSPVRIWRGIHAKILNELFHKASPPLPPPPPRVMLFTVNYPHKTLRHWARKGFPAHDRSTEPFLSHLPKGKWRLAERVGGKEAAWRMTTRREEVWWQGEETDMQVTCSPGCVTAWCCHENVLIEGKRSHT